MFLIDFEWGFSRQKPRYGLSECAENRHDELETALRHLILFPAVFLSVSAKLVNILKVLSFEMRFLGLNCFESVF